MVFCASDSFIPVYPPRFGRQQWRPGVFYEGNFREGYISGYGRMIWQESGVRNEEYRGQWELNMPHGNGVHIWDSLVSKKHDLDKQCSQQMNNKYDGKWEQGRRHGYGVFLYANGAKYQGLWRENKKHDPRGRYTFEDGNVYSGPFVDDIMTEYKTVKAAPDATLNIGGEDNPVLRMIGLNNPFRRARFAF